MSSLLPLLLGADDAGVKVEIAFNAGYSTAVADRVWTDVSGYVLIARQQISITYGRGDELSVADANSCTLLLNNSDGRFTPARSASPHYPNVKIGRPLRVSVMTDAGYTSVRFVGYIDEWVVEWPDTVDTIATTTITAYSRIARLGLSTKLRSIIEQEILLDGPAAYYTMGEAEGATFASDTSGNGGPNLVQAGTGTAVAFGTATGPSTDGLTAASLAAGKSLRMSFPILTPTAMWVEVVFLTTGNTMYIVDMTDAGLSGGLHTMSLFVSADGTLRAVVGGSSTVTIDTAAAFNDGLTHHVLLAHQNGVNATLYVDGVVRGTDSTANTIRPVFSVTVGAQDLALEAGKFTGTLSHLAWGFSTIASGRVAAHSDASLTGFAGETPAARLARYAAYAGIATADQSLETGETTIVHLDTTGSTVLDMMRKVETTEAGVLFDGAGGNLTFHGRAHRYGAAAGLTLDAASSEVEADFAPHLDRTAVVNDAEVANVAGTVAAHISDTASIDDIGWHSTSVETASANAEEPLQRASWLVNTYKDPDTRVPTLTAHLGKLSQADQAAVLAVGVGSRIDVINLPSQAEASAGSFFVEGYAEEIGPSGTPGKRLHRITFNVSPAEPYLNVWTVEDSVYGQYDAYGLAY